jgi:hypothetical protein
MAKATTIKDALKKLEETRGVNAAEIDKVSRLQHRQQRFLQQSHALVKLLYMCMSASG